MVEWQLLKRGFYNNWYVYINPMKYQSTSRFVPSAQSTWMLLSPLTVKQLQSQFYCVTFLRTLALIGCHCGDAAASRIDDCGFMTKWKRLETLSNNLHCVVSGKKEGSKLKTIVLRAWVLLRINQSNSRCANEYLWPPVGSWKPTNRCSKTNSHIRLVGGFRPFEKN